MCKGRDVLRTDVSRTCIGAYYFKNIDTIQDKCKFYLIPAQEHFFQLASNKWLIYSPINFPTTIKCPTTFTPITIRSSAQIIVPSGCPVDLKSHSIQPDSAATDSSLENIHYECSLDSNLLFPKYCTHEF
jgi:hypothetical protein